LYREEDFSYPTLAVLASAKCINAIDSTGHGYSLSITTGAERLGGAFAHASATNLLSFIFGPLIHEMDRAQWYVLLCEVGSSPQFQINDPLALVHSNDAKLTTEPVCCNHLANLWNFHIVRHFT
jgi:hypothetical protein